MLSQAAKNSVRYHMQSSHPFTSAESHGLRVLTDARADLAVRGAASGIRYRENEDRRDHG